MREVSTRGSATATELALPLGVTRQAVAKHLAVLADAGLVDARREGRETRYRPTPAPLGEAISWMTSVGGAWDERLAALERQVARGGASAAEGRPERQALAAPTSASATAAALPSSGPGTRARTRRRSSCGSPRTATAITPSGSTSRATGASVVIARPAATSCSLAHQSRTT